MHESSRMIFVRQREFSSVLNIEGNLTFIVHLPAFDNNFDTLFATNLNRVGVMACPLHSKV